MSGDLIVKEQPNPKNKNYHGYRNEIYHAPIERVTCSSMPDAEFTKKWQEALAQKRAEAAKSKLGAFLWYFTSAHVTRQVQKDVCSAN